MVTNPATPTSHITIVGGGPCGMTSGFLLARAGHKVTLLEGGEAGEPNKFGLVGARITRRIWTGFTAVRIAISRAGTVPTLGRFGPTWAVFDPLCTL